MICPQPGSRCGKIIHIKRRKPLVGNLKNTDYLQTMVGGSNVVNRKCYLLHRFVWEVYNCLIPDGYVVDHIKNNKMDNHITNL